MQDNARAHTAQNSLRFLRLNRIAALNHPARSPDLNPIEHIWDNLERKLRDHPVQPSNFEELATTLREL